MRIIHPEWRTENLDSNYPFADTATLAGRSVLIAGSTPLKDIVSSTDYTEMSVKAGHIGLSVGSLYNDTENDPGEIDS
jgi:hypothetical protein